MSRRLLGPVGGPIVFFMVAALVFGGLGWVTYAAIGVEQAQREAAARAEIGNSLRIALWRLDGRMLPVLGVEDSRPFYHYFPPDPASTPLLAANLPGWMKLHFQIDPINGWGSPQVLDDPDIADRVRKAWPQDVELRNLNGYRVEFLNNDLKAKFPAQDLYNLFAQRDLATPTDSGPFAVPLFVGELPPAQTEPTPNPAPQPSAVPNPRPTPPVEAQSGLPPVTVDPHDTIRVLGFDLPLRADRDLSKDLNQTQQQYAGNLQNSQQESPATQKRAQEVNQAPPPQPQPQGRFVDNSATQQALRGGRVGQKELENNRSWLERAGVTTKAIQDAREAGNSVVPGMYSQVPNMQPVDPRSPGNGNYLPQTGPYNFKNDQATQPSPPVAASPLGGPVSPTTPPQPTPGGPGGLGPAAPLVPLLPSTVPGPVGAGGFGGQPFDKDMKDGKDAKSNKNKGSRQPGKEVAKDVQPAKPQEPHPKQLDEPKARDSTSLAGMLAELSKAKDPAFDYEADKRKQQNAGDHAEGFDMFKLLREDLRARELATKEGKDRAESLAKKSEEQTPAGTPPSTSTSGTGGGSGSDRPPTPPPAVVPPPVPVQTQAIHLGSMRPLWLTAADGSEMLILVRSAKFDDKTVYQGVILDWAKLQAALKDEVKDLFPDATLVPVKDPDGVSPDRAMTALPVQLDVGPDPTLPPAGWTPLRIGLVLAWIAAIIAFAAVGFSGWSLIDLAERRIRFVSAVTHELRTPLTSLRLYLDLLLSGMIQDEAKRQEYLKTLALESDRLHRLIDNVLDFAKLEKRRKNGDIKPIKVSELLDQLRQTWTDRVAQDGKELVVISTLQADCEVSTDAAMIQQIVGNLIDNARKYTRDAADKRIWLWAKPGTGNTVLLEVEDRGPGVAASERRTIFKPFRRGEHADCKAGGAGLGLALAKSWAEVLGANLTYRTADGGTGACFRLELPGK
jgi:signal transduction histidine kinase